MGKPLKISDKNKPWARSAIKRKAGKIPERKYILIVCEGTKTEPNYFKAIIKYLPREMVKVEVHGEGMSTLSLVNKARQLKKNLLSCGRIVDVVWVVFDRDSFPKDSFDNAIKKAKSKGFGVAWSNEAFELWYLLHYQELTTAMNRKDLKKKLSSHLKKTYKKNDTKMYDTLKAMSKKAYKRAAELVIQHKKNKPHDANPCTHVHELVAELEAFL